MPALVGRALLEPYLWLPNILSSAVPGRGMGRDQSAPRSHERGPVAPGTLRYSGTSVEHGVNGKDGKAPGRAAEHQGAVTERVTEDGDAVWIEHDWKEDLCLCVTQASAILALQKHRRQVVPTAQSNNETVERRQHEACERGCDPYLNLPLAERRIVCARRGDRHEARHDLPNMPREKRADGSVDWQLRKQQLRRVRNRGDEHLVFSERACGLNTRSKSRTQPVS
eukprot:scaffold9142_cov65-Phaeocystis_antarctica.AAC.6